MLGYPNFNREVILETDASLKGLGAVLSQVDGIRSKFAVYTDNTPLAYVQTSKVGASQICWLSKLALFDFNITYRLGRTKKATDTLSQSPVEPNCKLESESDTDSKDPVMLSYATSVTS